MSLYPWLVNFRDKSVTELEFLHGFLNDPGHLPAAIFFRDKVRLKFDVNNNLDLCNNNLDYF